MIAKRGKPYVQDPDIFLNSARFVLFGNLDVTKGFTLNDILSIAVGQLGS